MTVSKEQLLNLIWENPVEIGHWVGFNDLTELHNKWLRQFLFNDKDMTLQAHRGSYKTTDLSLFFAIHTLIKPNETITYFRKTDTNVADIAKQTENLLLTGAFQRMSNIIYGHGIKLLKANNSEIDTNLKTGVAGQPQITGFGIGAAITGKHADIVVTDDIVTLKDRVSRAERERTKSAYMELQNIKNRTGRFINTGTPWHKEDAFTIMPEAQKYDCYNTGLITTEKIHEIQKTMTPSLFAANYELKHIADENAMFSEPKWTPNNELIYGGRAHIDAAYGGEDYTAYTILKPDGNGGYYGYGKLWHKHVDDIREEMELLHEKYKAGSISCETNGDKGYLAKELTKDGMYVNPYSEHENKYIKISTYLKRDWNRITWIDDTDPEYISQILDYTEDADHDDAPDSAASLIRNMEKGAVRVMQKPSFF